MENDAVLSNDDYGHDLSRVQAMRCKYEGMERDLAALNENVSALGAESNNLQDNPNHAEATYNKHNEIENNWRCIKDKETYRKVRLDNFYNLHRFLADFHALVSWNMI